MPDGTLVSILMPVRNCDKFLVEALDSCINQSHHNLEILVYNDASDDRTAAILDRYEADNDRIHVEHGTSRRGAPWAWNHMAEYANGSVIAWMAGDDINDSRRIELQLHALENNVIQACTCSLTMIDEKGKPTAIGKSRPYLPPTPSLMVYQKTFMKIGPLDTEMEYAHDIDWFIRAMKASIGWGAIEDPLYYYRTHPGQVSVAHKKEQKAQGDIIRSRHSNG